MTTQNLGGGKSDVSIFIVISSTNTFTIPIASYSVDKLGTNTVTSQGFAESISLNGRTIAVLRNGTVTCSPYTGN